MNKSIAIAYCIGFASTTLVFWLGGFDFDHRGEAAVFWFIGANASGIFSTLFVSAYKDLKL